MTTNTKPKNPWAQNLIEALQPLLWGPATTPKLALPTHMWATPTQLPPKKQQHTWPIRIYWNTPNNTYQLPQNYTGTLKWEANFSTTHHWEGATQIHTPNTKINLPGGPQTPTQLPANYTPNKYPIYQILTQLVEKYAHTEAIKLKTEIAPYQLPEQLIEDTINQLAWTNPPTRIDWAINRTLNNPYHSVDIIRAISYDLKRATYNQLRKNIGDPTRGRDIRKAARHLNTENPQTIQTHIKKLTGKTISHQTIQTATQLIHDPGTTIGPLPEWKI